MPTQITKTYVKLFNETIGPMNGELDETQVKTLLINKYSEKYPGIGTANTRKVIEGDVCTIEFYTKGGTLGL